MGLMDGKNALIFGVANNKSLAWGITQALHDAGANIGLSYAIPQLEKRVFPLAESIGCTFVERADANNDDELDAVFARAKEHFGRLDVLVHAIAYATREDLSGQYIDTSREGFKIALETSAYSLVALAKRAAPLMTNGGSILTLTYYGAEKVMPRYNVMAVAKAALECSVRYLAYELGPQNIRVNAISAGPVKTLAASGIAGFRTMLKFSEEAAPLRRLITQEDVGNTALWLASDLGSAITGETIYVDAGYNILGLTMTEEQRAQFNLE
ncbi:MAG: enoyl-ACP reductase [Anaerolineae bacterium]|nr:enoyl-ACP reductase [Anaerolineae bacterium]